MLVLIYIAAICAANLLVGHFGAVVTPINAFLLIAFDMSIRDFLHDKWGDKVLFKMPALIAAAGVISYLINPETGIIAVASLCAFSISAVLDSAAYHLMNAKKWFIKSNGSNVVGAAADSFIFPLIAFGAIIPEVVAAQFIAKVVGGFIFSAALLKWVKA